MVNLNNVNASDDPVWGQDDCHAAVDLLGGFFACRFDGAYSAGSDVNVVSFLR